MVEHQIWSVPPGSEEPEHYGSYDLDRWQWAVKLARFLEERGHTDVEIRLETGAPDNEDTEER